MNDTEVVAGFMAEMLSILGIDKIPETIIKQVEIRTGISNGKLKDGLEAIKAESIQTFYEPEGFNVATASTAIKPGEDFAINAKYYKLSEVVQDLFILVEKLLIPVLKIDEEKRPAVLESPEGFQFIYKTLCEYQEKYDGTDEIPIHYFWDLCNEVKKAVFGDTSGGIKALSALPDTYASCLTKYQKYLNIEKAFFPFRALQQKYKDVLNSVCPFLELPVVAEAAIGLIMTYGYTYEEAGGIYNKQFGCAYEPISSDVTVICVKCNKVSRFPEVHLNEKCVCGEPLFRKCRKKGCGMSIPRMVDVCPGCGTRESNFIQFEKILPHIKAYAERGCVEQAEAGFVYAENLVPDCQEELREIQKLINTAKTSRTETLNELGRLIDQRFFYTASGKLAEAKKKFPLDVLQNIENRIVAAENLADEMFSTADRTAEALQKVLAVCADHPGALKNIRMIPPMPPVRLNASICEGYIQLSWEASSEIGVQYRVIRKRNSAPATVFDGDGEFDIRTEKTSAKDLAPVAGKVYYAVFAERNNGSSSGGALASLLFLPEVSDFSLYQLKNGVEISYRLPKGASGVRVERKIGTENSVIYEGINSVVLDRNIPERCSYTVTAIFDKRESNGKTLLFTSSVFPKEIKPQFHMEQNRICVSWNTLQKGYDIKVLERTQGSFLPESGRLYRDDELSGKTRKIAIVSDEETSLSFEVTPYRKYTLLVMVGNPNGWLCCGVFPVFAEVYPKVARLPDSVDLQGNHYFLFEGSFSGNICGFSYFISKKDKLDPDNSFKTGKMEGYNGINRPMIKIPTEGQGYVGRYYIFCRFKLKNGEETEAMCSEIHFRQDIRIVVDLKVKGGRLKGDIQFKLREYDFEGYTELPELRLSAGSIVVNLRRYSVVPSKRTFSIPVNEQLPVLTDDNITIKIEPVDNTFINDFTINYND